MCGIAAAFTYKSSASPISEQEMIALRDRMTRRGPDAAGLWRGEEGRVSFGHRRLSIIDLEARSDQPMVRPETGTRICFNGEIYNFRALRAELEAKGHVFRTTSDTEVVLHAYDAYGTAMLERLRGMFALAIWDPARKGLLLARDPFGIKPLYYSDDGSRILAASQVKALLGAPGVDVRTDPAGKAGFLLWGYVPEPFTFHRGIRALPAGSSLWIDERGAREPISFWTLAEKFRAGRERAPPSLREALADSLRHHMVADVEVGLFLSAGLDSASLAALAADEGLSGLKSLTLGFDLLRGGEADEVPLAEFIARHCGTNHETGWIGAEQFAQSRADLMSAMDQPSIDGANVYFVSHLAAKAGLKVALSGLGGDELFGGYPSFAQIPPLVRRLAPLRSAPGLGRAFRFVSAPLLKHLTSPKYAGLLEYGASVEEAYLLRRSLFMPWELPEVMDPEEAREGWNGLKTIESLRHCTAGLESDRARLSALEISFYMRNQLLRDADWAGMAHSVEIRVPLVDSVLFETLAPSLAGPAPFGKQDMARCPLHPLPEEVLSRRKTGFSVPIRDWLREKGAAPGPRGLRGWAVELLGSFE